MRFNNCFLYFWYHFATVAYWLQRPPRERRVVGSIPGRDRQQSLKLVVVAFPLGAQVYGNSTTTGFPVSGQQTGYVLVENSPGNMDL